jgi:vancomycin permeability regulator SanA
MDGMKRHPRLRRWLLWGAVTTGLLLLGAAAAWWRVGSHGDGRPVAKVNPAPVAVVLGCAPRGSYGPNQFFLGRLEAAAQLWHSGRARAFLVSGDNSRSDYDEATAMRDGLVARGVPANAIWRDYAGFSTWDTIQRAKRVFAIDEAIFVSQDWHLPRCLYLAAHAGIRAQGCQAPGPNGGWRLRMLAREVLSRCGAVLRTCYDPDPRHLGPRVVVGQDPPS